MKFKYFKNAKKFASWLEQPTTCDFCEEEKMCFDASAFFGEAEVDAICEQCLFSGRLREKDIFTCEGDAEELIRQLKALHPSLPDGDIMQMAEEKTDELERTTPKITAWQDWFWPCADGDYCVFIGYGSQALYNELAPDGDGEELFKNSMYDDVDDMPELDELWNDYLPEDAIESLEESEGNDTLFYVFKSQDGTQVITLWDAA